MAPRSASATTWYILSVGSINSTGPATSCVRQDVQTAHDNGSVVDGDTLNIGTCASGQSWSGTTPVTISKAITLQGQGTTQTKLLDDMTRDTTSMLQVLPASG